MDKMTSRAKATHLGAAALDHNHHVCVFYRTRDEVDKVILPFIAEGLERGEKIFHMVDPVLYFDNLRRLESANIPVAPKMRSGQLEVQRWDETFLVDGHFDPEAMLVFIEKKLQVFRSEGYRLTRWIGQMEWPAHRSTHYNDFLEFEARVNYIAAKCDDFLVCTYDINKHDAVLILDALRIHPLVLIGEVVYENPFYIPPEEFLREQHAREASATLT